MNKFGERILPHIDTESACDMDIESSAAIGWRECKKVVLEILQQPIQNCDLSWEEVDKRFIEKIEKEV